MDLLFLGDTSQNNERAALISSSESCTFQAKQILKSLEWSCMNFTDDFIRSTSLSKFNQFNQFKFYTIMMKSPPLITVFATACSENRERIDHPTALKSGLFGLERIRMINLTPYLSTPVLQATHTCYSYLLQNLRVERIWPEVNNRVNYPIKHALVNMIDNNVLNLDDPLERFCVSTVTVQISHLGLRRFVDAWNNHYISGELK